MSRDKLTGRTAAYFKLFTGQSWAPCAFAVWGSLAVLTTASADERIGNTALVHNTVERVAPQTAAIQPGDDVFANENVRTGVESLAKFVFSDQTNLALGPTSQVKLDRFVYKGPISYTKAVVNFTAGAFRFTTGGSEKRAYELKTTTATIGVRGTVFDVMVDAGDTTITLVEGDVVVCPRKNFDGDPRTLTKAQLAKYQCIELSRPGQTTLVTSRRASLKAQPFSFAASFCSDGGSLCTATTTAAIEQTGGIACYAQPDNE